MAGASPRKIGLPWYRREDYQDIRGTVADPHNLAPTYDQWLAAAENNERVGQQAGLEIERVIIEPGLFAQWCADSNRVPDSAARMQYVSKCLGSDGNAAGEPSPAGAGAKTAKP